MTKVGVTTGMKKGSPPRPPVSNLAGPISVVLLYLKALNSKYLSLDFSNILLLLPVVHLSFALSKLYFREKIKLLGAPSMKLLLLSATLTPRWRTWRPVAEGEASSAPPQ